jgi:hypothetical protein
MNSSSPLAVKQAATMDDKTSSISTAPSLKSPPPTRILVTPEPAQRQEEADRLLAQALYAQDCQEQEELASFFLQEDEEDDDEAGTIPWMERKLLPVLELIWPEVYWPFEKGNAKTDTKAPPAAAVASSDTTTNPITTWLPTTVEGISFQKHMHQSLKEVVDREGCTTMKQARETIRRSGPLPLLEYFGNYAMIYSMENLVHLESLPCDLDCWDSSQRAAILTIVSDAVQRIGAERVETFIQEAKTQGCIPVQILESIRALDMVDANDDDRKPAAIVKNKANDVLQPAVAVSLANKSSNAYGQKRKRDPDNQE